MPTTNRFLACAAACVFLIAACSSSKSPADGGAGANGGGGQSGGAAGGGRGGAGGTTGTGGTTGAGGTGGVVDAGACRTLGQTCGTTQSCCVPFICAGSCTMNVSTGGDAGQTCTYADGGAPVDAGWFGSVCPSSGCPSGTVCVEEIGGVAGGGGGYCAPIPNECHGTPSCACMASCACTNGVGGRPETCSDQNGTIACDNGIR